MLQGPATWRKQLFLDLWQVERDRLCDVLREKSPARCSQSISIFLALGSSTPYLTGDNAANAASWLAGEPIPSLVPAIADRVQLWS